MRQALSFSTLTISFPKDSPFVGCSRNGSCLLLKWTVWYETASARAQTLCGQHIVSRLLARSEMLSQRQANTATHTWKPINKWNRKQKMKGKPHDTQILKYPSVPRPRPSSSLTESWLDCPWFFFFSTSCQICISGARPGGIRFKKDSLHSQKLISSSIPALGAPQPAARDRGVSELWPLESSDSLSDEPLHFFGRSAVTPVTVKTF